MKRNTYLLLFLSLFASFTTGHAESSASPQADGKATYEQYCSMCHASGLAGAPKFQNAEEWNSRLKTHGIDGLVHHSMEGVNGVMPPKGSCMSCTEQQLKDAIEYMLPPK
jgi:cytochrome c5